MRRPLLLFLLLVSIFFTIHSPRAAAYSEEFFQTEIKVASQEPAERSRALPIAFAQVLTRLTANPSVMKQQWIQPLRGKADKYLLQYRYESRLLTTPEGDSEEIYLICEFNGTAITQLLEQNSVAYWGNSRPSVVAWVLLETATDNQIIDGNHPDLAPALTQAARQTGLDIVLPLMDLQEQNLIQPYHIQYGDTDPLEQATARYNTGIFILSHIRPLADGLFTASWQLSVDGQPSYWTTRQPAPLTTLLDETLAAISAQLFDQYSHQPLGLKLSSEFQITNINDLNQYHRAWDYLSQLQGVTSVLPTDFAGRQAGFVVEHSGTGAELQRQIELGSTLLQESAGRVPLVSSVSVDGTFNPESANLPPLRYRLSP